MRCHDDVAYGIYFGGHIFIMSFFLSNLNICKHSISKIKPRECPLIKFKGRSFFFFHDIIHDLCSNGRLRFRYFRFAVHLSPLLAFC